MPATHSVETSVLRIAYERRGPADAPVVLLLHGFPDDLRTWDAVAEAEALVAAGYQTIAPSMRGCGDAVSWPPIRRAVGRPLPWLSALPVRRPGLASVHFTE